MVNDIGTKIHFVFFTNKVIFRYNNNKDSQAFSYDFKSKIPTQSLSGHPVCMVKWCKVYYDNPHHHR